MKRFIWGVATSSHQVEGGNTQNDWWAWEESGNIEGGVRSGSATDHWNRRRSDLELAKSLSITSYRFSIEWSRIEPREGVFDETALRWYSDLLDDCDQLQLMPMATLHHFTLPKWFADQGGFSSPGASEKFLRYVRFVTDRLGSRIPYWCTLNEPLVLVAGSYLGKFMPPAVYDPKKASMACHQLLRSHVLAYDYIHANCHRREGVWSHEPLMVGYAHNMIDFRAERKYHPLERFIAKTLSNLYNFAWIEATTGGPQKLGFPGLFPRAPVVKEALNQTKTDYIGVNYYTKAYIQWWPRAKDPNQVARVPLGVSFARRNDHASDLEWAIYPKGLGRTLKRLKRFALPIIITENGIADRDDSRRPQYLILHLKEIAKAIENGLDIRGYYHWSLLDNFEWIKGFGPRFGLYRVNYKTFERRRTASADLFESIVRKHEHGPPRSDRLGREA